MMKRSAGAARGAVVSSSPGRAEKLPAPPGLARFLMGKSGSGSRSRGRGSLARSSPMFVSRSRSIGPSSSTAAEEGEPSSPKVTCIGQVRIRATRSKKSKAKQEQQQQQQQQSRPMTMRCRCLERALLCKIFTRKPSAGRPRRSLWRRWALSLRSEGKSSYQKALEREAADLAYPPPVAAARGSVSDHNGGEESEEESEEEETRVFMSSSATTTPPKNALLLMRCRSAPHNRSSSLATTRFAVSPLAAPESSAEEAPGRTGGDGEEARGPWNGISRNAAVPLVLTRCKSEPARTAAEKLVVRPEAASLWSSRSSSRGRQLAPEDEGAPPPLPSPHPL